MQCHEWFQRGKDGLVVKAQEQETRNLGSISALLPWAIQLLFIIFGLPKNVLGASQPAPCSEMYIILIQYDPRKSHKQTKKGE